MAKGLGDGLLRLCNGAWRDDDGDVVDIVEVVRCKNCDDYDEKYPGFGRCKYFDIGRTGNDFCSSGQRRDNG